MKNFYFFLVTLVLTSFGFSQTTLSKGDIAIVAYSTPDDSFAFVTFVELEAGTEIYFTDEEADGDFTISLNEGHLLYTAPSTISPGTVITGDASAANFTVASSSWAPGNSGDGVIAYQGTSVGNVTTFLHAVGEDSGDTGTFPANTLASNEFLLLGNDDGNYSGITTGSATSLFSAINDIGNWTVGGSLSLNPPLSFSVTAGGPTITFDAASSSENETDMTFNTSIPVTMTNYDMAVTVSVSVDAGSTAEASDYTLNTTSLSFTANETLNISLDINDDADTDDETIILNIAVTSGTADLGTSQHTVTIVDDETPPLPNIVINEILADPTGIDANGDGTVDTTQDEFIELVNNDIVSHDITGYTISDAIQVRHTFGSVTIPAGGSIVVFGGGTPTGISGLSVTASTGSVALNNGGDTITLEDTSSNVIATYTYGGEASNDQSIGRSEDIFGSFVQHTTIQTNSVAASPGLYNTSGLPFSTITWKGAVDSDWTNAANWSGGTNPTGGDDVLILDVTTAPSIGSAITVNNVTVNAGASLSITSSGSLTATSTSLYSFSNLYSSLILDGSISGTVNYSRYVNTNDVVNGNDLISAPLSGQAFNTFFGNNSNILSNPSGSEVLFGGFDNDDSMNPYELWLDTATTPLAAGQGYRTGIDDTALSNFVNFEGAVNSSNVLVAIDQGTASILNLVGNPFPSYLDAQAFLTENASLLEPSAQVIYGYNDSTNGTSSDDYTIISSMENTSLDIAPGQAFFVASNSSGGDLSFTTSSPDMRLASDQDDFIAGRNALSTITNVNISLNNASDDFITKVYFTPSSGLGLDPGYDASLIGGIAPAFALFSHLIEDNMNVPFATQALGIADYNDTTVALGVNANMGEQLTFSIAQSTLPAEIEVYLDDTVTSTSTLLNSSDYIITPNSDLTGTGRFYLRFSNSLLSTPENSLDSVKIYTDQSNRTITISGQLVKGSVARLYDIQGRLVNSTILNESLTTQTIGTNTISSGVYIIELSNNQSSKTEKIILK